MDHRLRGLGGGSSQLPQWETPDYSKRSPTSGLGFAFAPGGQALASASEDHTVKLWDVGSGGLIRTLERHTNAVCSVTFDPSGRTVVTASEDRTVRLWEVASGKLLLTMEGHTADVLYVSCFGRSCLLASKGRLGDNTVRLWRADTGACVAIIPEAASGFWPPSVSFHPHLPVLATVGSIPGTSKRQCDRVINIWEFDPSILLGQPSVPTVTHTSAKIVVIGESNVGKSYLAHRIATGSPPKEGTSKVRTG